MIRCALYVKHEGDTAWRFVATDHCDECERQDFKDAAILFAESDRSFGFNTEYMYVVAYGVIPSSIREMSRWPKL